MQNNETRSLAEIGAMPWALIFCGSRKWIDDAVIRFVLRQYVGAPRVIVIHGDAKGADKLAGDIASSEFGFTVLPMPAQWGRIKTKNGRDPAGPIRNRHMLAVQLSLIGCGYKARVHAFSAKTSTGTPDMKEIARTAGIEVIEHGEVPDARPSSL